MTETWENKVSCILDGCRGIYIPQTFAQCFDTDKWGVSQEDVEILLSGPDHEHYWDAWQDVIDNASILENGNEWTLHQDSDLFAIREDMTEEDWEEWGI